MESSSSPVDREKQIREEMKALQFDEDMRLTYEELKRENWNPEKKALTRDELAEHVGRVALYVKRRVQPKYSLSDEEFDRLYMQVLEED
jgi:hypothetical protein